MDSPAAQTWWNECNHLMAEVESADEPYGLSPSRGFPVDGITESWTAGRLYQIWAALADRYSVRSEENAAHGATRQRTDPLAERVGTKQRLRRPALIGPTDGRWTYRGRSVTVSGGGDVWGALALGSPGGVRVAKT
jgi:hypothetical protein